MQALQALEILYGQLASADPPAENNVKAESSIKRTIQPAPLNDGELCFVNAGQSVRMDTSAFRAVHSPIHQELQFGQTSRLSDPTACMQPGQCVFTCKLAAISVRQAHELLTCQNDLRCICCRTHAPQHG